MTRTPIMGEYNTTRGTNKLTPLEISSFNLDESKFMTSVNGMDPVEVNSTALHLPPQVGLNKLVESDKVSNSISLQYLNEFILDVLYKLHRKVRKK